MPKRIILMHGRFASQVLWRLALTSLSRIIKDSYLKTDPKSRPRVFGMTASPIDVKGDVVKAAMSDSLSLPVRGYISLIMSEIGRLKHSLTVESALHRIFCCYNKP